MLPCVLGEVARVSEEPDEDVLGGDVGVEDTASDETGERDLASADTQMKG